MPKTINWLSELKTTENEATGHKRYFIKCCDYWKRVSKIDYDSRAADANRTDRFLTQVKNGLVHQYKTVYGMHTTK